VFSGGAVSCAKANVPNKNSAQTAIVNLWTTFIPRTPCFKPQAYEPGCREKLLGARWRVHENCQGENREHAGEGEQRPHGEREHADHARGQVIRHEPSQAAATITAPGVRDCF
jgi:hypothetical protein